MHPASVLLSVLDGSDSLMHRVPIVRIVFLLSAVLAVGAAAAAVMPSAIEPSVEAVLLRSLQFSPAELADLPLGKVVKHTLDSGPPGEIGAVGAVRVNISATTFIERFRDIAHFKRGPGIVQIGRFSDPPALEDLAALTVGKEDLDVRACHVGDCDIRLPKEIINRFQREIDWSAADAQSQAAGLFKQVLVTHVRAYVSGGPGRIVEYDDNRRAVRPIEDFSGLLNNSPYIGELMPGLPEYLRAFPSRQLAGAENFLYWSKEKFGLNPFITVTHVTIVRVPAGYIITTRDVYSSRYFDASLAVSVASHVAGTPDSIYLVYANRSRIYALKGPLAALRRAFVERRVKNGLEENLRMLKTRLEQER